MKNQDVINMFEKLGRSADKTDGMLTMILRQVNLSDDRVEAVEQKLATMLEAIDNTFEQVVLLKAELNNRSEPKPEVDWSEVARFTPCTWGVGKIGGWFLEYDGTKEIFKCHILSNNFRDRWVDNCRLIDSTEQGATT